MEHLEQRAVTAVPYVCVDEGMTQVGAAEVVEVHRQERDIGGDIRVAKAGIELDAIKQIRPPAADAHAAGVQITVAITDAAIVDAALQQVCASNQEGLHGRVDRVAHAVVEDRTAEAGRLIEVLGPVLANSLWSAV